VKLLIGRGHAKVNVVDRKGETPAMLARRSGMPESILKKLTQAGEPEACEAQREEEERASASAERLRKIRERQEMEPIANDWRTWRAMHPRRGAGADFDFDSGAGVGDLPTGGQDDFGDLEPKFRREGKVGSPPFFVGRATAESGVAAGGVKATGRISRLRAWASGLAGSRRTQSTSPHGSEDSDFDFESYSARASRA